MFEFGRELATQVQEGAPALVPVGEQVYRELNQSAIQTFFNGAEQIIKWLMGIGVLVSIGFFIWGFILLNHAADNPQMWAKARNPDCPQHRCRGRLHAGVFLHRGGHRVRDGRVRWRSR